MARHNERGAVAVEFAILLPVLLLFVMGIMEFGRAYNAQISLTHAARESVRVMAISNDPERARIVAINSAPSLNPLLQGSNVAITVGSGGSSCALGAPATVTISYTLSTVTGIVGPISMKGKGVMQCGG